MRETIKVESSHFVLPELNIIEKEDDWKQSNGTHTNDCIEECNVCNLETEEEKVVTCDKCNTLVHFHCTRLPPYTLYVLSTSSTKYVCEVCADVPETFLLNLIPTGARTKKEAEDEASTLETKANDLCELVGKYDLPSIEDKIHVVYSNLEKINSMENSSLTSRDEVDERLHATLKELTALRASEKILLESLGEKDKFISTLSEDKLKHIKIIDEMNKNVQSLQGKISKFKIDTTNTSLEDILVDKKELEERLLEIRDKCTEKDYRISSLVQEVELKQKIINIITIQLSESHERNKALEGNLALALEKMKGSPPKVTESKGTTDNGKTKGVESHEKEPNVFIFHDILCKDINESILINEGIVTKKVWAPTFSTVMEKVEDIKKTDTIVLQSLSGSVADMSVDELVSLTAKTVDKCLSKANKVIISSIIKREDNVKLGAKVDLVNASIKYKYLNNPRVLICNNDNLQEKKFMLKDRLQLTEHGTSLFANNLKYKMAQSLGISVVRKRREPRVIRKIINHNQRLSA